MKSIFTSLAILVVIAIQAGCTLAQPIQDLYSSTPVETPQAIPTLTVTPMPLPTIEPQTCGQICVMDGHFLLQNPIPPGANQSITGNYRFGSTLEGEREIHHGVEFNNPSGTPVLAAAEGEVVFAGNDAETTFGLNPHFYGNLVILSHHLPGIDQPVFTLYAHLSEVLVITGDAVTGGQQIGKVGRSGSAQGSHLHFEVRLNENTYAAAVNPELWLTLTPGTQAISYGALAGVFLDDQGEAMRVTSIRLEYSPVEGGNVEDYFSLSTYYDDSLTVDPVFHENFVISGLTPGWYRVTSIAYGSYISKWVPVESGKMTFLTITLP
jgi:hypothetical protein